jgi:hypothetical protein
VQVTIIALATGGPSERSLSQSTDAVRDTACLQHPNIVPTLAAGLRAPPSQPPSQPRAHPMRQPNNASQFWLVQGACHGKDLASAIAEGDLHFLRLRWSLLPKLRVLRDIAQGITHMHAKGLAHGGLSSSCVVLEVSVLSFCVRGVVGNRGLPPFPFSISASQATDVRGRWRTLSVHACV